jgi:hypothetical protein
LTLSLPNRGSDAAPTTPPRSTKRPTREELAAYRGPLPPQAAVA